MRVCLYWGDCVIFCTAAANWYHPYRYSAYDAQYFLFASSSSSSHTPSNRIINQINERRLALCKYFFILFIASSYGPDLTWPDLFSPFLPCSSQCSVRTVRVKHAHTDRVTDTDTDKQHLYKFLMCCSSVLLLRISSALTASRMRRRSRAAQLRLSCIVRCSERWEEGQRCGVEHWS